MYSFAMAILDHPREVSVTEATQRGVAGIITDAEAGDILVTRRNRPVAAIVSIKRVERLERMLDELRDLTLAMSRAVTDDGDRISFDDVLSAYGMSRADLEAVEADDGQGADG
jgi:prevent-host-death family protein